MFLGFYYTKDKSNYEKNTLLISIFLSLYLVHFNTNDEEIKFKICPLSGIDDEINHQLKDDANELLNLQTLKGQFHFSLLSQMIYSSRYSYILL